MKEENLIWIDKLIKDNPDYFKQGIIHHCRKLDKYDVYEWVANDEIKIQQLHKEKDQLQNNWNELKKMIQDSIIRINECAKEPNSEFNTVMKGTFGRVLNMMQELEGKSE